MKRKLFSALLFGAFAMASTSTFTSCKDYDDDIQSLQTQIDALSKAISEIQDKLKDGVALTGVESVTDGVKLTLSNGSTYTITNGKDGAKGEKGDKGDAGADGADGAPGADGKAGSVVTIGSNGNWFIDGVDTGLPSRGEKGEKGEDGKDGQDGVTPAPSGSYWQIDCSAADNPKLVEIASDGTPTGKEQEIKTSDNAVNAVWDTENGVLRLTNVKDADGNVQSFDLNLSGELRSLVFNPDFYYQGIEAFDAGVYKYEALSLNAVSADANNAADRPVSFSPVKNIEMIPDLSASYWLNPSNATIDTEDASKYEFIVYNKSYTRSSVISPKIYKAIAENGMVTVKANLDNANLIKDINNDNEVTVLALQYKADANATVITSDFAALKASEYTDLAICGVPGKLTTDDPTDNHLWETAAGAIGVDASANASKVVKVAWNNDEGIDLRKFVQTHRRSNGGACTAWDADAAAGTVEKAGFKYKFELVGYKSGTNQTSQSAHGNINKDGYTFRPQLTKDGKQQPYGYTQSEAAMGREPVIRVQLIDTIAGRNNVAAVGYFKIQITSPEAQEADVYVETATTFNYNDPYTVACGNNDALTKTITWDKIEEGVYAYLGMSKEAFEGAFKLEGFTSGAQPVSQFAENTKDATALPTATINKFGEINKVLDVAEGTTTEVLKWTVKNEEAYELFKKNASRTVYVRFVNTTAVKGFNPGKFYVYVGFSWTPSERNVDPKGEIDNDSKINSYWYPKNGSSVGTPKQDIHGNVEVVGQTGANDEFVFDMLNAFVGNKVTIKDFDAKYSRLTTTDKFYFTTPDVTEVKGYSGTTYVLSVSSDGTKLQANKKGQAIKEDIAILSDVTGADVNYSLVTYQSNEYAKDVLNYADHKELGDGQTLTAKVGIKCVACDPVGDIPLTNNTFNVKFLRPISVSGGNITFQDGKTGGDVQTLDLTFTDWRDHNFTNTSVTGGHNYFVYYGVKSISVPEDLIETNINGTREKLNEVTSKITLDYTAPSTNGTQIYANSYGYLKYENNGTTVGNFELYIPVDVTYYWGTMRAWITAKVKNTVNN